METISRLYNQPVYIFSIIFVAVLSLFLNLPEKIDSIIYGIFVFDLLLGTSHYFYAHKKNSVLGYLKHNIFDLLACVPLVYFGYFKIFRLLRVVRIAKIKKIGGKPIRFSWTEFFTLHTGKEIAIWLLIYLIGNIYIFSEIEGRDFIDSLYWMVETFTTVGYGDIFPTQTVTKLMTIILMIIGLAMIGFINGVITNSVVTALHQANKDEKLR